MLMGAGNAGIREGKVRLIDIDAASFDTLPCCGIKSPAHPGRKEKRCWLLKNAPFGLRAKTLLAPNGQPSATSNTFPASLHGAG